MKSIHHKIVLVHNNGIYILAIMFIYLFFGAMDVMAQPLQFSKGNSRGYTSYGTTVSQSKNVGTATTLAETVNVPSDSKEGTEGNLNKAISNVVAQGKLSTTVFMLELNGRYILDSGIVVPQGEQLTIIAPEPGTTQETAPPQILWTAKDSVDKGHIIICHGHLTMKNVWILYTDTTGWQHSTTILFVDAPAAVQEQHGVFENVIFDYSSIGPESGGAITIECKHFIGRFSNSYFRNCVDSHFSYYGRAISFPSNSTGWHCDSVIFENCSFANIGYVLMQERSNYYDYVRFNHCTFENVAMYPLESGWWYKLAVTNCLFSNCWMRGWTPMMANQPEGAILKINSVENFGFTPWWIEGSSDPEQERRIIFTHSSYSMDKWLVEWMAEEPTMPPSSNYKENIPLPQPMLNTQTLMFFDSVDINGNKVFPFIKRAYLYNGLEDSLIDYPWPWGDQPITQVAGMVDRLIKNDIYNPRFINPPTDTGAIKGFLKSHWWGGNEVLWAWKAEHSFQYKWPLEENLAYTNDTLKQAGMGNFPLGDIYRWWPELYAAWQAQAQQEQESIEQNLVHVNQTSNVSIPFDVQLYQNYPNPFNPITIIEYQLPEAAKVTMKVFDLLGREVATLVHDEIKAGNHTATFDGSKFASGIYFVRMTAQSNNTELYVKTMKIVLMK